MKKILLASTDLEYAIDYDNCNIEDLKKHLDDIQRVKDNIMYNFETIYDNRNDIDKDDDYIDGLLRYYDSLRSSITHLELTIKSHIEYLEATVRR